MNPASSQYNIWIRNHDQPKNVQTVCKNAKKNEEDDAWYYYTKLKKMPEIRGVQN